MSQTLSTPSARSWRDIPQDVTPRAMSREGRRRLTAETTKIIGIVAVGLAAVWGGIEIFNTWRHEPAKITAPVKSAPVKEIALRTDGVLDRSWVAQTLALPRNASLMEVDLAALQLRLLASGQAHAAVVTRKFPDTLVVVLQERTPVVRVVAQVDEATQHTFLVARDGLVYAGHGYDPAIIDSLPYLSGTRLVREGAGFARIAGMNEVAELLGTALADTPALYRNFTIVSLERYAQDGIIVVKSRDAGEVLFGLRQDFYTQIARLDYVVDRARAQPDAAPLKQVNLAVGGLQVPVSFEAPPIVPGTSGAGARKLSSAKAAPGKPRQAPRRPEFFPLPQRSASASSQRDI